MASMQRVVYRQTANTEFYNKHSNPGARRLRRLISGLALVATLVAVLPASVALAAEDGVSYGAGAATNNATAAGTAAIAASSSDGAAASAAGTSSIALGVAANANSADAIALGNTAQATATDTIAVGRNAEANGIGGIAIGSAVNAPNRTIASGTDFDRDRL